MGRAAAVRAATKGKTDAKKAKVNAYYGKKIIMAVKQGGSPDPVANRQLGELIKAAKANSVPVDNINRAIKRATEKDAGDFAESTFEAYGQGGASFIINVLSDNANRSTADVKSAVNKLKGKMAESGFFFLNFGFLWVQMSGALIFIFNINFNNLFYVFFHNFSQLNCIFFF